MGEWTREPAWQQWASYYDTAWEKAVTLDANDGLTWWTRPITKKTRRGWELGEQEQRTQLDMDTFIPVDTRIKSDGTYIMLPPSDQLYKTEHRVREAQTWEEYITTLPEWERTLLAENWETASYKGLCAELMDAQGTIIIVSDGGQKGDRGTFGWVIGTKHEILWEGRGAACGQPMTPHRAEAYGKLSWICFLKHFIEFFNIQATCKVISI